MAGLLIQQDIYQGCDVRNVEFPISIDITTLVFQNALVKLLSLIDYSYSLASVCVTAIRARINNKMLLFIIAVVFY